MEVSGGWKGDRMLGVGDIYQLSNVVVYVGCSCWLEGETLFVHNSGQVDHIYLFSDFFSFLFFGTGANLPPCQPLIQHGCNYVE